MHIQDRIKELRRVKAAELRPHAKNWRTHPPQQRDALRGILAEVGYADALIARELEDGALELIDGHLRAETTPEAIVPVLVLDVTAEEADKILATLDPLAGLAECNLANFDVLMSRVNFENPAVQTMLAQLRENASKYAGSSTAGDQRDSKEIDIPDTYEVVVECASEQQQRSVYERLTGEGWTCRVVTI